jgi:hypothetical protein
MQIFIHIALALFTPTSDADAEALHRFAPSYVTVDTAREHLWVARVASSIFQVKQEQLLAIAWHESRYKPSVISSEPRNRVSCGPMTPVPKESCTPWELSLVGGYIEGARHLRTWLDLCGSDERCALTAYAGGFGLVKLCQSNTSGHHACNFANQMISLANRIKAPSIPSL